MTEHYPLTWPTGWPRTKPLKREKAKFEVSFAKARDELLDELHRLGACAVVISSNIPVRKHGLPYATYKEPSDPGVAVYFRLRKKPTVLACDRWLLARDNLRAIGLHIAALRGIERWGVGSVEQVFMGYEALPPASQQGIGVGCCAFRRTRHYSQSGQLTGNWLENFIPITGECRADGRLKSSLGRGAKGAIKIIFILP